MGKGSKTVLGSTHVVEQLSFSMFPSILTFDFDLLLGSFFTFGGPKGRFQKKKKKTPKLSQNQMSELKEIKNMKVVQLHE